MSNNIWRCRCGKRVEMLTDENFGDCGCSDPVYGPEYFYMSTECADMLDEMDKDYDEQYKHLEEAQAEIENLQWRVSDEQAKTMAVLELNSKALELVNEARADAEHWKSECNALQRMVHEARADIARKDGMVKGKSMSETPRTDAEFKLEAFFDGTGIVETVLVEFAQELESELADKDKQLFEARAEIERKDKLIEQMKNCYNCKFELHVAKECEMCNTADCDDSHHYETSNWQPKEPEAERVRRNLRVCVECGYVEFIAGYDRCNACYQRKYRREKQNGKQGLRNKPATGTGKAER